MRNVIVKSTVTALLILLTVNIVKAAESDDALKRKIDSLFIIASSGEVMYRDQNEPAMDSIAAIGVDAVPYLIDKFTTKSARERWTVIWTLQRIGSPAVPDLVAALYGDNPLVVERVCYALGQIKDSAAVKPLMNVSGHERWQVRDEAVAALGKIGDKEAEPVVVAAMADTIGQVRKSAAVSCRKLGLTGYEPQLVHMLGDDFYGARMCASEALLLLDTATVMQTVIDSVHSRNGFVGNLGCWILGRFGNDPAMQELYELSKDASYDLRAHAAVALVSADPQDLCGYRQRVLDEETDKYILLRIESAIDTSQDGH